MRFHRQAGVTLIELMIVVGLIAVLAAVVLPNFFGEGRKVRADSEVMSFFPEIAIKEEAAMQTRGIYLSSGAWLPVPAAAVAGTPNAIDMTTAPVGWRTLRFSPPTNSASCTYLVRAGDASVASGNLGDPELAACGFVYDPPPVNWYYILAACDADNDDVLACYLQTSDNAAIRKSRHGD